MQCPELGGAIGIVNRGLVALRVGWLLPLVAVSLLAAEPEPAKLHSQPTAVAADTAATSPGPFEVLSALIEQLRPLQINSPHVDFFDVMWDAQVTSRRWRRRKSPFRRGRHSAESPSNNSSKSDNGSARGGL